MVFDMAVLCDTVRGTCLACHARSTAISACDLIAYLSDWNGLVLKLVTQSESLARIDFSERGYKGNALGALTWSKTAIVYQVNARGNVSSHGMDWYGKHPLVRVIQLHSAIPLKMQRCDCRAGASRGGL